MAFIKEEIPDSEILFIRIHEKQWIGDQNRPSSACFGHTKMSVNWAKYSTPQNTAKPTSIAVGELIAGQCRTLNQTIEHDPVEEDEEGKPNQAHTEICGLKSKQVKDQFVRLCKIVWRRAEGD